MAIVWGVPNFTIFTVLQEKGHMKTGKTHNSLAWTSVQCDRSLPYRKNSKNWDTLNYYRNCPTNGILGFYSAILRSKDADRITNRKDTDQTAPWGAVWSGSALFAQTYLSQYFQLLRYSNILYHTVGYCTACQCRSVGPILVCPI